MKFNITSDQNNHKIIQCELPKIGYFLIRREGLRPVLSLEEPWCSRLRPIFRIAGVIGFILVILEGLIFLFGIGGLGLILLMLGGFSEIIDITQLQENQVIRGSAAELKTQEAEAEIIQEA